MMLNEEGVVALQKAVTTVLEGIARKMPYLSSSDDRNSFELLLQGLRHLERVADRGGAERGNSAGPPVV